MKGIDELQWRYFLVRAGLEPPSVCVAWAIDRLERNEEGGDLSVALLAGLNADDEVRPLVERILASHGAGAVDEHLTAGKYIVELRRRYQEGSETYETLDLKLSCLYRALGYPTWLVMLSRNCEFATDVPAFREPFEAELAYIAGLWDAAESTDDFLRRYDRGVSNSHDLC